ncbi:uncharacterized protein PG986_010088 [Apiospora aurea]|uniref:RING-type domain-containing protein n=1 Tax=Apiospora aurea TaxID=335848 RepID=A0ABR1Q9H7_9PEZI
MLALIQRLIPIPTVCTIEQVLGYENQNMPETSSLGQSQDQSHCHPGVPCGHVIGSKCFAAWAQISKQCPICRKDVACSSCHEKVPAPLCSPFKTNQDGVYSFFPYDAILQYIPKTESEWDSPPGKIYCGKCVSEQAVVLMASTLIGNLDCSLCLDKSIWFWSRESFDQHRAVRQQAADAFFRSRLLDV